MTVSRPKNPVVYALYANAVLLLAILAVLLFRPSAPSLSSAAFGQPQPQNAIAGGAGIFLMPGQIAQNLWGCYVMDVDRQTLCAYEYYAGDNQLRLVAARNFVYDLQLKNFSTSPKPQDIQALVDKEKQSDRVIGSTPQSPSPEVGPKN